MSSGKASEKRQEALYVWGAIATCVFAVAVAVYSWSSKKSYDLKTHCEEGKFPQSITFLIDATTALSPSQTRTVVSKVSEVIASTPVGTNVRVYSVDPSETRGLSNLLFEHCRIERSEDVSNLSSSKLRTNIRYQAQFEKPLLDAFTQAFASPEADNSPLIEAVVDYGAIVSPERYSSRHLYLISDLKQHSSKFSLYRRNASDPQVQNEVLKSNYIATLAGADVEIWLLIGSGFDPNDQSVNGLVALWSKYLAQAGANVSKVTKVR